MKFMYSCYLTLLHALAFLLLEVAGQPPSSASPTINGPRLPTGHDEHSHNRAPVVPTTKVPTTPLPSKLPTVPPVAKPIPNPPRLPTKNKHHRGPTDTPVDSATSKPSPLPTNVPTGGPTGPPTNPPTGGPTGPPTNPPTGVPTGPPTGTPTSAPVSFGPCSSSCDDEEIFSFFTSESQSRTFDASCVSSSATVAINRCNVPNLKANFFSIYFDISCLATVSVSGASFASSIYVLSTSPSDNSCPGVECVTSFSPGSNEGGSPVSWSTTAGYGYDVMIVPGTIGASSIYTLNVNCV